MCILLNFILYFMGCSMPFIGFWKSKKRNCSAWHLWFSHFIGSDQTLTDFILPSQLFLYNVYATGYTSIHTLGIYKTLWEVDFYFTFLLSLNYELSQTIHFSPHGRANLVRQLDQKVLLCLCFGPLSMVASKKRSPLPGTE